MINSDFLWFFIALSQTLKNFTYDTMMSAKLKMGFNSEFTKVLLQMRVSKCRQKQCIAL